MADAPWSAVASLFDACITLDRDGAVHGVEPENVFGRTAQDMLGRPLTDFIPRAAEYTHHAAERGWWRTRALHADGTLFGISMSQLDIDGRTVVFLRDLRTVERTDNWGQENDAWWEVQLATRQVLGSSTAYALHGLEPERAVTIEDVLDLIEADDRQAIEHGLAELLAGRPMDALDYRLAHPAAGGRVIRIAGRPERRGSDGVVIGLHGWVRDVTEERREAARLAVYDSVATALRQLEVRSQLDVRGLLQRLFLALEWRVAVLWVPNGGRLRCRGFVTETGMELQDFEKATRALTPREDDAGVLCSRAWAERAPVAVPDFPASSFRRAAEARREGLRSGLAIPALHHDEVLAVFEFYSNERRDMEAAMRQTLEAVAQRLGSFLAQRQDLVRPTGLTPREREVLAHSADGASISEIADRLQLSPATVKTHFQNVYAKLGVNDRPAAVAMALRTGAIK